MDIDLAKGELKLFAGNHYSKYIDERLAGDFAVEIMTKIYEMQCALALAGESESYAQARIQQLEAENAELKKLCGEALDYIDEECMETTDDTLDLYGNPNCEVWTSCCECHSDQKTECGKPDCIERLKAAAEG